MTPGDLRRRAAEMAAAYGRLPLVAAVFLGGSLTSGKADIYSDIDLYVIAREGALPDVIDESTASLQSCGELLFLERVDHGFPMDVFIYADGARGEVGFGTPSSPQVPWLALACRTGTRGLDRPQATLVLEGAVSARGYLARGDLWSAADRLGEMRSILAAVARAGGASSKSLENDLRSSFFALEVAPMQEAFRALCTMAYGSSGRHPGSDSTEVLSRLADLAAGIKPHTWIR